MYQITTRCTNLQLGALHNTAGKDSESMFKAFHLTIPMKCPVACVGFCGDAWMKMSCNLVHPYSWISGSGIVTERATECESEGVHWGGVVWDPFVEQLKQHWKSHRNSHGNSHRNPMDITMGFHMGIPIGAKHMGTFHGIPRDNSYGIQGVLQCIMHSIMQGIIQGITQN